MKRAIGIGSVVSGVGILAVVAMLTAAPRAHGSAPATPAPSAKPAAPAPFRIGIATSTVSQGEDEFRAAAQMAAKYPNIVKHITYPDNFMQEQETTISQIESLAADPLVKAIIIAQAVPGSMAAIQKVKANRPAMKFLLVEPHEDPAQINKVADVVFNTDTVKRGTNIVRLAKKMGATKLIHYSFPRHLSMELVRDRRKVMEDECKAQGLEFINATAPDPMGEGGLPASQQFILEDVPRKIAQYGKNIAFFCTNCGMQEPLIRTVLDGGAIYPEQCCPSPTHAYPGALGIEVSKEKAGDMAYISAQIKQKIAAAGGSGRFATWRISFNMSAIRACVELAKAWCEGKANINSQKDVQKFLADQCPGEKLDISLFDPKGGQFYVVAAESQIF